MADGKSNGRLDVFTIVERAQKGNASDADDSEKKYWVKIGAAFVNRDESLNVYLDAVPIVTLCGAGHYAKSNAIPLQYIPTL